MVKSAAAGSEDAINHLAEQYWQAIYAYFRVSGRTREDAADLVQEFLVDYILNPERRRKLLGECDAHRGRFRTWLRAALRNFALNAHDREMRHKRGGERRTLSLDFDGVEGTLAASGSDPDAAFERHWVLSRLGRILARLVEEQGERAMHILRLTLQNAAARDIAAQLGMSEDAVLKARSRARQRSRELLEQEARATVDGEDALAEEMADADRLLLPGP